MERATFRELEEFVLMARRLPKRCSFIVGGILLGFLPHEMTRLYGSGLLDKMLLRNCHFAKNGHKWLCTEAVLRADAAWLAKATKCIMAAWQAKNSSKVEEQRCPE